MTRNQMKKLSFFIILLLMLGSCSSNEFKIDGNISGVDGVRIVFNGDSGVVDEWVTTDKKGRFSFTGTTAEPVLVSVMDIRGEPLAMVVAAGGNHLKLKGDAAKPQDIKMKGSRLTEDWQLFRDEHAAFYTDPNPSRLDAAIEKYVREHPDDMLSTVLLLADYSDYSDRDKVDKMLDGIKAEARPESLVRVLTSGPQARKRSPLPRLMSLTLFNHDAAAVEIPLTGRGTTLISLWANPQNDRATLLNKLKTLEDGVRVIDVLAEGDTLRWNQTTIADPESWQHYWAPGGPLEPGIQTLGITSLPWYAVTDSTGMVTYSGPDLTAALGKLAPRVP